MNFKEIHHTDFVFRKRRLKRNGKSFIDVHHKSHTGKVRQSNPAVDREDPTYCARKNRERTMDKDKDRQRMSW